jgi:hypothetical protein
MEESGITVGVEISSSMGCTCRSRETRGCAGSVGGGRGVVPEWENKVIVSYSKIMRWVGQLNETPSEAH